MGTPKRPYSFPVPEGQKYEQTLDLIAFTPLALMIAATLFNEFGSSPSSSPIMVTQPVSTWETANSQFCDMLIRRWVFRYLTRLSFAPRTTSLVRSRLQLSLTIISKFSYCCRVTV